MDIFENNGIMHPALLEAYASAPTDVLVLAAVEINHPAFDQPARIVNWPCTGNAPEEFLLKLEADAPYNPGAVVKFLGFPFEITVPNNGRDGVGAFKFRVDGVGSSLDEHLTAAALEGGIIQMSFREYVKGQELDGPSSVYTGIEMRNPKWENGAISAEGAVIVWVLKPYGTIYTPEKYPGIVRGR